MLHYPSRNAKASIPNSCLMEVSRSVVPYAQLPVWLMCIPTTIMQQEETVMGTGQNDKLELSQGKTPSHRTMFWKENN